jgi:hypothetical protein
MSKMESGNFEIVPELFAPRESLIGCCNLMVLKARENGIDIVTRAPLDLPQITGDPRAFKQMLLNLLSNAIKFSERDGTVTVTAGIEGSRLMVRVIDNGVGIGAEDLKRIGDPFFQAERPISGATKAPDLGFPSSKPRCDAWRRDDRAEPSQRRHHRDRRTADGVYTASRKAQQYRDPCAAARRTSRLSGEEKCLDKSQKTMRSPAAAAVRPQLLSRLNRSRNAV